MTRMDRPDILDALVSALQQDSDRTMAASVVADQLTLNARPDIAERLVDAVRDSGFVEQRVKDLQVLRQLCSDLDPSTVAAILDGASGWLEENAAACSPSRDVLVYLAQHARRRRARSLANERLEPGTQR